MKIIYCYASVQCEEFEKAQENALEITKSTATTELIRYLIGKHAIGQPPFQIEIPNDVIWSLSEIVSSPLFKVEVIDPPDRTSALGVIAIQFRKTIVYLTYRRCLEMLAEPFSVGPVTFERVPECVQAASGYPIC